MIMTKQTKILAGLLAGAALGAVVALVISSDKNDELKGKVSDDSTLASAFPIVLGVLSQTLFIV